MCAGKLKKNHINKGYGVLKKIEKVLGRVPINKAKLTELTNEFYSLIPYAPPPAQPQLRLISSLVRVRVRVVCACVVCVCCVGRVLCGVVCVVCCVCRVCVGQSRLWHGPTAGAEHEQAVEEEDGHA